MVRSTKTKPTQKRSTINQNCISCAGPDVTASPAGTGSDTDRVARDQVSAGAGKEATLITHRENSNEDKAGPEDNQLQRQKQHFALNTSGSPPGTKFVNRFSLIIILDLLQRGLHKARERCCPHCRTQV